MNRNGFYRAFTVFLICFTGLQRVYDISVRFNRIRSLLIYYHRAPRPHPLETQ